MQAAATLLALIDIAPIGAQWTRYQRSMEILDSLPAHCAIHRHGIHFASIDHFLG